MQVDGFQRALFCVDRRLSPVHLIVNYKYIYIHEQQQQQQQPQPTNPPSNKRGINTKREDRLALQTSTSCSLGTSLQVAG